MSLRKDQRAYHIQACGGHVTAVVAVARAEFSKAHEGARSALEELHSFLEACISGLCIALCCKVVAHSCNVVQHGALFKCDVRARDVLLCSGGSKRVGPRERDAWLAWEVFVVEPCTQRGELHVVCEEV